VTHYACTFIGNLDHLTIIKTDAGARGCLALVLLAPVVQNPHTLGLALPPNWSVEAAQAWPMDPVRGCTLPATNALNAVAGSGTIVIHDLHSPGATVDVNVQLAFTSGLPPPPVVDRISVVGLAVSQTGGC
jgi:hypothetical protein